MTSQPMKPSEAKCKLQCDLAEHEGALRRLELERVRLALPASSGDRTAVERLRSIRVEITEKTGMVEDLQQALVDIEPQVLAQHAAETLDRRRQDHAAYEAEMDEAAAKLGMVDDLIDRLVAAVGDAEPAVEAVRMRVTDLIVRRTPDIGGLALNRLFAYDSWSLSSPAEQAAGAVSDMLLKFPLETRSSALKASLLQNKKGLDVRIAEKLREHERVARAAGVDLADAKSEAAA